MNSKQSDRPDESNIQDAQSSSETQPDKQSQLFPVVGIGASAGGLEAYTQLLRHLPIDTGMAFVLVQHLDPNQNSLLSEILARTTQMPVCEARESMVIEPNHVYVIPSGNTMTVAQGKLHLMRREKTQKINKVVDIFFNSLAEERGEKAIAVVLSGGDFDGTQGLEAIEAAGGITFAQSRDSAQVSSMPHSAISSGQVDFILPPEAIATALANISRHPYIATTIPSVSTEESLDRKDPLHTIFNLLKSAFGINFAYYKQTTIKRRILRRMALYRLDKLDDYVDYLQENQAEVQALYQEILIHVTSFFRDAGAFEILKREVFPALLRDRPVESPIRIWVAGCSTGEEVYSIAICLLEFLYQQPRQPSIQIFATDVSETAIQKARIGIYLPSQVTDISPDRLQRFFVQIEGGYQIQKMVRELCVFARQNMIDDPPFSRMDLISCRNVLIYFASSLQKKVLPIFHYALKPNGFLLLGSSETVGDFANLFHLLDRKHKIYAKQSASLSVPIDLGSKYFVESESPPLTTKEVNLNQIGLSEAADRIVLRQYAPVGVIVNAYLDILQFRGMTGAYLEPSPGQASLNLLSMVKEELRLELRTAIHQAKKDGKAVRKEGITLKEGERSRIVRVDVVPIDENSATSDNCFLILFEEMLAPTVVERQASPTRRTRSARKQKTQEQIEIQRLEQELENTRAYLKSIVEEQQAANENLRAANEEILSSNEELQSTNEELQTAKEEIQATNEELSTINEELYQRNAETTHVSNDFQNLLASINIPILMLEGDLRIRRFTPTAAPIFNLIPTDIGRPLSDIKHNLNITDLEAQILEVIDTLTLKSQEVQDRENYWYDLRIRPYRTLDNRIDGAVVVLVGIDALKRSSDQVREARVYAEAIAETVRGSLVVLNTNYQVVMANQRFYDTFQVSSSETEKCQIFDLGNGQLNIPLLKSLIEDILPHNSHVENFQVEHKFEDIGQKIMLFNARKIRATNGDELILLEIEDISDR